MASTSFNAQEIENSLHYYASNPIPSSIASSTLVAITMADQKNFCPHCTSLLSRKAYATHKRLYYDGQTDQWVKKQKLADEAVLRESEKAMEAYDFEAFHSQPSIVTSDTELHPPSPINFDMSSASGKEVIIDGKFLGLATFTYNLCFMFIHAITRPEFRRNT